MLLIRGLRFMIRRISPGQFIGPSATLLGLLALGFAAVTGKIDFSKFDIPTSVDEVAGAIRDHGSGLADSLRDSAPGALSGPVSNLGGPVVQPVSLDRNAARSGDRIRIATFNIQRFGEKKSANADVMRIIALIVSNFDLVAIQEVQSPQAMPVAKLVDLINRSGGRYDASVSEPIGRTTYREQYAFVWDATRIRMIPDSGYVVRDDSDRMHRPPMVASFETRIAPVPGRQPFRFTMINAHTDPSQVSPRGESNEMNVLDDVFIRVREYEYQNRGIMNVMLVGDLNVSTANLGELGRIPGVITVVGTTPTNTAGTKTYDHILFDSRITTGYTGIFGVIDYEREYGLTSEQAAMVSDHRPVWAEFSAYEMPPIATASRETAVR
jgi:deoxyribonuclease-1-like protein